jgi:hypothetical protein
MTMSKRNTKFARLNVEALDSRIVPSVTFQEDTSSNRLTLTAAQNQNNTITIVNNGNGGLRVTADGVVRNFTGIVGVNVATGNGADTVTYNQGSSTTAVNLRRDLTLNVELGDNASGTMDRFTANVFGDIGFLQNGAWQARSLGLLIHGNAFDDFLQGDGNDRIDINVNHDTDVRPGSQLFLRLHGDGGNDNITLDYDGEMDGRLDLSSSGADGNDTIAVNLHFDAGSNGRLLNTDNPEGQKASVRGDAGNDTLRFAVRQAAGATAEVSAVLDGGFGFGWPDNDIGRHTTNVQTLWLEQDIVIQ